MRNPSSPTEQRPDTYSRFLDALADVLLDATADDGDTQQQTDTRAASVTEARPSREGVSR